MKRGTIELKGLAGGTAEVEGYISDSGHLAVHRRPRSARWQVTHIPSGSYVAGGPTARILKARVAGAEHLPDIDWGSVDPFALSADRALTVAVVAQVFRRYPKEKS